MHEEFEKMFGVPISIDDGAKASWLVLRQRKLTLIG